MIKKEEGATKRPSGNLFLDKEQGRGVIEDREYPANAERHRCHHLWFHEELHHDVHAWWIVERKERVSWMIIRNQRT
jgi:hypothetical protein